MRHVVNSRADLENLRGTDDFEDVLRSLHGAFTTWNLVDGAWVAQENLSVIERFDYDKAGFLAEIEPFDFPAPVPPDLPVEPDPVDPLTLTLTKRQVNAALILAGHTDPDAFVEGAVDTIADPTQKALALNDWRFAPYFQRSHPLLNDEDVLAAASLTPEQVDGLWAVASTLPA